jgi:chorismate synthase
MAGNSFGTLFRFTTWGESHGPAIGVVVDGVPPRLPLAEPDIQQWLDKRKPGQSRYTTQRREADLVRIRAAFDGVTTGTDPAADRKHRPAPKDYRKSPIASAPATPTKPAEKYGIRDYRRRPRLGA